MEKKKDPLHSDPAEFFKLSITGTKMFQECTAKLLEYLFNQPAFVSAIWVLILHLVTNTYLERPTLLRAA